MTGTTDTVRRGGVAAADRHAARAMRLLQGLLRDYRGPAFTLRLWDGREWRPPGAGAPRFALTIRHPSALAPLLSQRDEAALAGAYIDGALDLEGDLATVLDLVDHVLHHAPGHRRALARLATALAPIGRFGTAFRGRKHSLARDRRAVSYHYDVSNEFYALWLDPQMVYSCAYFEHPEQPLADAQIRKLDYVCRKLRLRPGERLLDVGCGWGALLAHAVRHYGVTADGVTLSAQQAAHAERLLSSAGLDGRARVLRTDYRQLAGEGRYDRIVSVGMFEHVGLEQAPAYFAHLWRLLRPGGVLLNHAIAGHRQRRQPVGRSFIDTYVFPDGDIPPLDASLAAAEGAGFEVRDTENLREHYALTLRRWLAALEARAAEARALVPERTYRIWRLYLAGTAQAFARGWMGVFQTLLVKPDGGQAGLPLSRADWYR